MKDKKDSQLPRAWGEEHVRSEVDRVSWDRESWKLMACLGKSTAIPPANGLPQIEESTQRFCGSAALLPRDHSGSEAQGQMTGESTCHPRHPLLASCSSLFPVFPYCLPEGPKSKPDTFFCLVSVLMSTKSKYPHCLVITSWDCIISLGKLYTQHPLASGDKSKVSWRACWLTPPYVGDSELPPSSSPPRLPPRLPQRASLAQTTVIAYRICLKLSIYCLAFLLAPLSVIHLVLTVLLIVTHCKHSLFFSPSPYLSHKCIQSLFFFFFFRSFFVSLL